MKKILIILIILFCIPLNIDADTINYKWYKVIKKDIEYVKKEECNNILNEQNYKENILYNEETNTTKYLNEEDVFFKNSTIDKSLDIENILYFGINNVKMERGILVLNTIHVYDSSTNKEINYNFVNCKNCGSEGNFIATKTYLELYNNGEVLFVLHEKVKANNLKIDVNLRYFEVASNINIFASSSRDIITYNKTFDNKNIYTKNDFNVTSSYKVPSYLYYEKLYECYKEEKEYADGYYEQKEGYIKDEEDYIIIKDELVKNDYQTSVIKQVEKTNNKEANNIVYLEERVSYKIEEKPKEKINNRQKQTSTIYRQEKKLSNINKKNNNKLSIFYIMVLIILTTVVLITSVLFVKKSRTK